MGKVSIVTLAAMSPTWLAVVCKHDQTYSLTAMPLDAVVGVHKDLLTDAMLIVGGTEEAVQRGVDNAFPGYRRTKLAPDHQSDER